MSNHSVLGYKGFDANFKCRDFQFQVGKDYVHGGKVKTCESGFHFCERPFDVWGYYPPTSRFAKVTGGGVIVKDGDKTACSHLSVGQELPLMEFIKAGVDAILNAVNQENKTTNTGNQSAATNTGNWSAATNTGNQSAATNTGNQSAATNTGDWSAATNTGCQSAATNTGDRSAATNTGCQSAATVEGKDSVAIVTGYQSKAKGALGCWLVLTERASDMKIINGLYLPVDGVNIKENVFYTLINGKPVEAA